MPYLAESFSLSLSGDVEVKSLPLNLRHLLNFLGSDVTSQWTILVLVWRKRTAEFFYQKDTPLPELNNTTHNCHIFLIMARPQQIQQEAASTAGKQNKKTSSRGGTSSATKAVTVGIKGKPDRVPRAIHVVSSLPATKGHCSAMDVTGRTHGNAPNVSTFHSTVWLTSQWAWFKMVVHNTWRKNPCQWRPGNHNV